MLKLNEKIGYLKPMFNFKIISSLKNRLIESQYYKKFIARKKLDDFREKLIAIINFQKYIEDQTSFSLERRIYVDTNNRHLEKLKEDLNNFLDSYLL